MDVHRALAMILACTCIQAMTDSVLEIVSLEAAPKSAEAYRAEAAAAASAQREEVAAQERLARSQSQKEEREAEGQVQEQSGCNCEWLHRQLEGMPINVNGPAKYTGGTSPLNYTESATNKSVGHKSWHNELIHQEAAQHDEATAARLEVQHREEHAESNRNSMYREMTGRLELVPSLTEKQERDDASRLAEFDWAERYRSNSQEKLANTEPYPLCPPGKTCGNNTGNTTAPQSIEDLGETTANTITASNTSDAMVETTSEVESATGALEQSVQQEAAVQREQDQLNEDLAKQQQKLTETAQTSLFQKLEECHCTREIRRGNNPLHSKDDSVHHLLDATYDNNDPSAKQVPESDADHSPADGR